MRYIWDLFPQYQKESGLLTRAMMNIFGPLLRQWDVTTAARVDHFIANSAYVAKRIRKFYRREATVIHPPVDLSRFAPVETPGDYYLCAGAVTPYKRLDIAVAAFNQSGKRLVVIGSGVPDNPTRHVQTEHRIPGRSGRQKHGHALCALQSAHLPWRGRFWHCALRG